MTLYGKKDSSHKAQGSINEKKRQRCRTLCAVSSASCVKHLEKQGMEDDCNIITCLKSKKRCLHAPLGS